MSGHVPSSYDADINWPIAPPLWCCPACRAALRRDTGTSTAQCVRCTKSFPVLNSSVPVLILNPTQHLARAVLGLETSIAALDERIRRLPQATWSRLSNHVARECNRALVRKRLLLHSFSSAMLRALPASCVAAAAARPSRRGHGVKYLDIAPYAIRDWSGYEHAESEIRQIEAIVEAQVRKWSNRRDQVVVLGAGAGRIAWDCQDLFETVVAVDDSPPMALAFEAIVSQGLTLSVAHLSNVRTHEDTVAEVYLSAAASARVQPHTRRRLHYCIADGSTLPLPDHSAPVVLSVYFTDVAASLTVFCAEVARVLIPGGVFVHVGPLLRHGDDRPVLLTGDDVISELTSRGFTIVTDDVVRMSHCESKAVFEHIAYDNLCLTAVSPKPPRHADRSATIAFRRPVVLNEYSLLGEERADIGATIEVGDAKYRPVPPEMIQVLRLIDGHRTVGDLLDCAGISGEGHAREVALRTLADYDRLGVISITPGSPKLLMRVSKNCASTEQ